MQSIQFVFKDEYSFRNRLLELCGQCAKMPGCSVSFYLAWVPASREKIKIVTDCIESFFPDAIYYGNEAAGSIQYGKLTYDISVTCNIFEDNDTKTKLLWFEEGTEFWKPDDLWKYCKSEQGLRAVEMLPSIAYNVRFGLDSSIPDIDEEILIFGGVSVNNQVVSDDANIIAKGHPMSPFGMVVILYYGQQLNLSANYVLGWQGLGRAMEITKSVGNIVSEIDGLAPKRVFEKYLGLEEGDKSNTTFPLLLEEDGYEYIRTPQTFLPDDSMQMFAIIPENAMVRISYGDKKTIIASLYEKAKEVAAFKPQTLKVFSCIARRAFWGDEDIHKETVPLQSIAPVNGFYTGGEILRFGKKLRVLNQTLVAIGFREGDGKNQEVRDVSFIEKKDKSVISQITYFLQVIAGELQDALDMADSANRAKTEFLFNMSHDIRTPMNAILGFTNMAMNHIDDKDKLRDYLGKIQKSGDLLLSLINNVLEVSRIEAGKDTVNLKPGDIYDSFENVESTMRIIAAEKDIDLSFEFGNIFNRSILCDFPRCARVFVNIISNAVKYSKAGGYVKVRCEQIESDDPEYGMYRYTCEDNGLGMSEEFQKHVFEQFSRESTVTTTGIQGTGLGMSVCKAFVDMMHGTIECRSKLGEGTTFVVTLPFRILNDMPIASVQTSKRASADAQSRELRYDFKGKHVLLAEDNELNREIVYELLSEKGMTVDEAENGAIAVDFIKQKGPDYYHYVLMDIQMPVMNGYDAARTIRSLYPDSGLPIIALSANAFSEDRTASVKAGMNAHVAKPINVKELFDAMAGV